MAASDNLSPSQFRVAHWAKGAFGADPSFVSHTQVDGKMTPEVKHAYKQGQCHALAMAINHTAGHPIGAVYEYRQGKDEPMHFFNYDKKDRTMGFDADGYRPVEKIVSKFHGQTDSGFAIHGSSSVDEIRKTVSQAKGGWMKPNVSAAMTIAPTILSKKK
jgi:hypothetical protein